MATLSDLGIKLFSDGADFQSIMSMYANPWVKGFTTNPTLMRKAGILDYEAFGRNLLRAIPDRPISLEVFADDEYEMESQAFAIADWGPNVNVKIPVTNCTGVFMKGLIQRLSRAGVTVNITAILTLDQVRRVADALDVRTPAIVSVFAGRIADTGVDPVPIMQAAREILRPLSNAELLWASPREVLNVFQADDAGCHIITVPPDMLQKLSLVGKDLAAYSLETVAMFYKDACASAYRIHALAPAIAQAGASERITSTASARFSTTASA